VISVTPLPHVDATYTRIMAGYLLLCEASDCVSLLYCELRSYSHGEASFAVYRDELCEVEVAALQITESTVVRSCSGVHCNIFGLGKLRFCARTNEETEHIPVQSILSAEQSYIDAEPISLTPEVVEAFAGVKLRSFRFAIAKIEDKSVTLVSTGPRD